MRCFVRYTLNDVLGQSREAFAKEFRTALQTEMDWMSAGIEAIAVVVEAIHPPPGTTGAYHNVLAAESLAKSRISFERADAVRKKKSAEQTALADEAKSESVLFEADHKSYAQDGRVVLFERWLDRRRTVSARASSSFSIIT